MYLGEYKFIFNFIVMSAEILVDDDVYDGKCVYLDGKCMF